MNSQETDIKKELNREYYQKHKEQIKEQCRKWKQDHPEQHRAYSRKYYQDHPEMKQKQREYNHCPEVKQHRNERLKKYYQRPEIKLKRNARQNALNIPLETQCLKCNSTKDLQRAHLDYQYSKLVFTLCRDCHFKFEHIKFPEEYYILGD
jgi:hypothetical protein